MAKRHCRFGVNKRTHRCLKTRRTRKGHRGRRPSSLHKRGRKAGHGTYAVACAGKRVYTSTDKSAAETAAKAASKRMGTCVVFTKHKRVAQYGVGHKTK